MSISGTTYLGNELFLLDSGLGVLGPGVNFVALVFIILGIPKFETRQLGGFLVHYYYYLFTYRTEVLKL